MISASDGGRLTGMRWLALLSMLVGSLASAQEPTPANGAPATERRTATEYVRKLQTALTALATGDTAQATGTLREAIATAPDQAAGHCHLGSALRRSGDTAGALESFRTCARLARQHADALNEGRGLLGVAQVLVLDTAQRDAAREAVSALLRFAETHPSVYPLELAQRLQQALDSIIELDAVSAEVRQRREERAAQQARE